MLYILYIFCFIFTLFYAFIYTCCTSALMPAVNTQKYKNVFYSRKFLYYSNIVAYNCVQLLFVSNLTCTFQSLNFKHL